jgi:hypothetical protein
MAYGAGGHPLRDHISLWWRDLMVARPPVLRHNLIEKVSSAIHRLAKSGWRELFDHQHAQMSRGAEGVNHEIVVNFALQNVRRSK